MQGIKINEVVIWAGILQRHVQQSASGHVLVAWFVQKVHSGFTPDRPEVCSLPSPSQSLFPAFYSSEIKHNTFTRGSFFNLFSCRKPNMVPSTTVVQGSHSEDGLFTLFNGRRAVDGTSWELIRGLGYSGSSLPSWLGLSPANLLYCEDFPSLHTWGRRGLDSDRTVSFDLITKKCKVLKTQQGVYWWETTSILLTHAGMLYCHAQASNELLEILNIIVG